MKPEILMSQLIAMISASDETNKIQLHDGSIAWSTPEYFKYRKPHEHNLSIKWDRGCGFGSRIRYLNMSLIDCYDSSCITKYIYTAYYYQGDNCNSRNRFLYGILADEVRIIDDLGITGHGGEIKKTYLTKLSSSEYSRCVSNARERTPLFFKGKWIYKEDKNNE